MTLDIDLTKHSLIEASAGTGKTYTIENLVVRILVEKKVPLSQILLVTFTEKATSEMKARIRKKLEIVVGEDHSNECVLGSLKHFDQASVMTIHSFCKQVLQQYSLENGILFDLDLGDTAGLYQSCLRRIQRQWSEREKTHLDWSVYRYQEKIQDWEDMVLRMARDYNPGLMDRLSTEDDNPDQVSWNHFTAHLIEIIHHQVRSISREKGVASFDDLLRLVDEALYQDTPAAQRLLESLRNQYRYAFVDEFQDTDPTQWRIFRKIFIEHDQTNRIFLVGDPKQSIYRFRGADIFTYLSAKETLQQIGRIYNLDINWRSTPGLISFQNWIFSTSWFPPDCGIDYCAVQPPPGKHGKRPFHRDRSRRKSAVFLALPKLNAQPLRHAYSKWITAEIERLLSRDESGRSLITIQDKDGSSQPLRPGDICILVNTRNEGETVIQSLQGKIPYTFYKKTGIYTSEEALNLFYLLDALAHPESEYCRKRALLTDFIQADLDQFMYTELPPTLQPGIKLLDEWCTLAAQRRWTELFDSIVNDSLLHFHHDTTWTIRDDRSIANYRHLVEDLLRMASKSMMDIKMLTMTFDRKRRQRILLEREEDLHRIDTDDSKVQVMTIHASKGLEFPVVFLAGISLRRSTETPDFYHRDGVKVFRVGNSTDEKDQALKELEDEQRRLYYVAITRAMNRVYIPLIDSKELRGNQGTIYTCSNITDDLSDYCEVLHLDADAIKIQYQQLQPYQDEITRGSTADYKSPDLKHIRTAGIRIDSFSSLHHQSNMQSMHSLEIDEIEHQTLPIIDDVIDSSEPDVLLTTDPLPPGAKTGDLLHAIFQWISFEEVAAAASPEEILHPGTNTLTTIDQAFRKSDLSKKVEPADQSVMFKRIAEIVWNTLHLDPGKSIKHPALINMPSCDRRHEIEFHISDEIIQRCLPEIDTKQHPLLRRYLKGYIDLVFRHEGRYYVVDWKSNSLPSYTQTSVSNCIRQNQYDLQYSIYWIALSEWLRITLPDYNPAVHLGGVSYYFIRGTQISGPGTAIFHQSAEELNHRISRITPHPILETNQ